MDSENEELVKRRDIAFSPRHPDSNQAQSASLLLLNIPGIQALQPINAHLLHVEYDITKVTLRAIETGLAEVGFHLDNSLFAKVKRALMYYCEETQLANLGYSRADSKSTTSIFTNSYANRDHSCRDERPPYYRYYN